MFSAAFVPAAVHSASSGNSANPANSSVAAVQLADQRSVLAVLAVADSAKQSVAEQLQQAAEKLAFHSAEQLLAAVQSAVWSLLLLERLPAM